VLTTCPIPLGQVGAISRHRAVAVVRDSCGSGRRCPYARGADLPFGHRVLRAQNPLGWLAASRLPLLVLVVVVAVSCVSAAVVDVVDVVAMRDCDVATAITVNMVVLRMHVMPAGGLAFVVVIVMPAMKVTVVQIVDVITVRDCNMSAAFAVDVRVLDVFVVNSLGHRFLTTVLTWFPPAIGARAPTLRHDPPLGGRNG
jgi:hypothetical protein